MKLDDFIRETLSEIIRGVSQAQLVAAEHNAQVNPHLPGNSGARAIEFDVEVSTTAGTESKGGGGVFVGPIGFGAQGREDEVKRAVGRIKFNVLVTLPAQQRK